MSKNTDTVKSRRKQQKTAQASHHAQAASKATSLSVKKTHMKAAIDAIKTGDMQLADIPLPEWDEFNGLNATIASSIADFCDTIYINFRGIVESKPNTPPDPFLTKLVETAMSDCSAMADQLNAIKAKHSDKTGRLKDIGEMDVYYELTEDYNRVGDQIRTLFYQTGIEITTYLAEMEEGTQNLKQFATDLVSQNAPTEKKAPL